jgi:transposase-like protein
MGMVIKFNNLFEFLKLNPTEKDCVNHLEEIIWQGKTPTSPHDPNSKVYKCADKKTSGKYPAKYSKYKCKNTGKYFNVKTGTIFENSNIPLKKWFLAMCIFSPHKKSINSYQLAKFIGITQKSGWFVLHRLRFGNCSIFNKVMLGNIVEIDETFIGGKNKNRHRDKKVPHSQGRSLNDKITVWGAVERNGNVIAQVVSDTSQNTLEPLIKASIKENATINTDEWKAYNDLHKWFNHQRVNHGIRQYVNGVITTNSIESFWAIVKRIIYGTYHHISKKHAQKYIDEIVFRYNTRKYRDEERFNLMLSSMVDKRLTYQQLIS